MVSVLRFAWVWFVEDDGDEEKHFENNGYFGMLRIMGGCYFEDDGDLGSLRTTGILVF